MTDTVQRALEMARHELTTLHGLVVADGVAPDETWSIDTRAVIAALDDALGGAEIVVAPRERDGA